MLHNMRVLAVGDHFFIMNKTSCFKSRHFINIYIINRTLHGRLGIRILSSRAESISHSFTSLTRERYLQHLKIKFVSPRGHVISSIFRTYLNNLVTICYRDLRNTDCSKKSFSCQEDHFSLSSIAHTSNNIHFFHRILSQEHMGPAN